MKYLKIAAAIFFAGASVGSGAVAQTFYAGASYDYGIPDTGDNTGAISLLGGAQFGSGTVTYGPEMDASVDQDGGFDTLRLRAVARTYANSFSYYASAGLTNITQNEDSYWGFNYGVGIDARVSGSLDLRTEIIRDQVSDFSTDATNLRIGLLFHFQ